jgi:hypothetical protein
MNLLWEGNAVDDDMFLEFIEAAVAATDEDDGVGSTTREQAGSEDAIQVGSDDIDDDEERGTRNRRTMGLAGTVVESDEAAEVCGFSADCDGGDEGLG